MEKKLKLLKYAIKSENVLFKYTFATELEVCTIFITTFTKFMPHEYTLSGLALEDYFTLQMFYSNNNLVFASF